MKTQVLSLILAAGLILTSCRRDKTGGLSIVEEIDLEQSVSVSEIGWDHAMFQSTDLVRLEMNEKSIIGGITQMELTDEHIFILDKKTSSLLMFDRDGTFIRSISSRGQGPEEYLGMSAFYLKDKKIHIIDPLKMKILIFNFDGKFIKAIDSSSEILPFVAGVKTPDGKQMLCHTTLNWIDNYGCYLMDKPEKAVWEQLYDYPIRSKKGQAVRLSDHPICPVGGVARLLKPYSDTIYTWQGDQFSPTYILKRNRKAIEREQLQLKMEEAQQNWIIALSNIVKKTDYSPGIKNIFETERYLCLDFYHNSLLPNTLVWDKEKKTGIHVEENVFSNSNFSSIFYSRDNELVRIWATEQIGKFKEKLVQMSPEELKNVPMHWREVLETFDEEEENPMLLIYKLKE